MITFFLSFKCNMKVFKSATFFLKVCNVIPLSLICIVILTMLHILSLTLAKWQSVLLFKPSGNFYCYSSHAAYLKRRYSSQTAICIYIQAMRHILSVTLAKRQSVLVFKPNGNLYSYYTQAAICIVILAKRQCSIS